MGPKRSRLSPSNMCCTRSKGRSPHRFHEWGVMASSSAPDIRLVAHMVASVITKLASTTSMALMPDAGTLMPGSGATLRLSAEALATATALAYSPACRPVGSTEFGCALASAVATAQRSDSIGVSGSGPQNVPVRVTLQATAYATAVARANDILGSGRCESLPAQPSPYQP
jgi:hypothetical protein